MNPADRMLRKTDESLAHIEDAARLWSAFDSEQVECCRVALEAAVQALAEAEMLARQGLGGATGVRTRVTALQREAARMERLVDAASAFLRGAFPTCGGNVQSYGAGGHVRVEGVVSAGLEG